jgi:hypothetical protein
MTIPRDAIITALRRRLEPNPQVLAMWLEGADATNSVDSFSDIDICCSVTPGAMDAVTAAARQALESLDLLDLDQATERMDQQQHTTFHLEGTSPYLLIDFCVYVGRGSTFIAGDEIEKPLILFDRAGVIRFLPAHEHPGCQGRAGRLQHLVESVEQGARIDKYILRGDFLEALGYYQRWLLTPLIEALRMRYTPHHPDYYIVHISRHLPADVVRRLEDLFKVNDIGEIDAKSKQARQFFAETVAYLRSSQ